MPSASSCSAARTTSSTERLWPRWMTSAPWAWIRRRMMLIAASWPSNRLAAVTKRSGVAGSGCVGGAGWEAAVFIPRLYPRAVAPAGSDMPPSTTVRLALACLLPLASAACAAPQAGDPPGPPEPPEPPIVEPSPRLVLLGEVHDNAEGHRQRLEAVRGY